MTKAPTVFLNYRREDSQWAARAIYEKLRARLGPAHVFMDVDIPLGGNWRAEIRDRVDSCDAMLVVIGERWLSDRIFDDDPFRGEIEAGLAREQTLVVPILVDGAIMPSATSLPPQLVPLLDCQAHSIPIVYFDAGVDRLIEGLLRAYGIHPDDPTDFQINQAKAAGTAPHADQHTVPTPSPPSHAGTAAGPMSQAAASPVPAYSAPYPQVVLPQTFAPQPPAPEAARSRKALWLSIAGVVGVIVVGVALYLALKPGPTPALAGQAAIVGSTGNAPAQSVPAGIALVGPIDGTLQQVAGSVELSTDSATADNFEASATFTNPSDTSSPWDYGFLFRDSGKHDSSDVSDYRLWIDSTGKWYLKYGTSSTSISHGGPLSNLNLTPGGKNYLMITLFGGTGNLFVNGAFEGTLNVSAHDVSGFVQAATGFVSNDSKTGRSILYSGFTVMPGADIYSNAATLQTYRPNHASSGPYIWPAVDCSGKAGDCTDGPSLSLRNYWIQADFRAPATSKPWDYGFFLRSVATNTQYAVVIDSSGRARCFLDQGRTPNGLVKSKLIWSQPVTNLFAGTAANNASIWIVDDQALLSINNSTVTHWSMKGISRPGFVMVMSNAMTHDASAPAAAISNFDVLSLDS